jgi:signal peptidase I
MNRIVRTFSRVTLFLILSVLCGFVLYFRYFTPPFSAIPSQSMEPHLKVGDLILVEEVVPENIEQGDVIVVNVPKPVRDRYHFPSSIVHRVVNVKRDEHTLLFRIKGDNNSAEDPFTVVPEDIMGQVHKNIPYAGYPVLFLHSNQGYYFIISSGIIYLLYIMIGIIERKGSSIKRKLTSMFTAEIIEHTKKIEENQERTLHMVDQSLQQFSLAMNEYAKHIASHTDSVKGLAASAKELEKAAQTQNEVLKQIKKVMSKDE